MITLNLQMFAKSASQAKEYRKRKAKLKYELEAELKPKEEEKKPEPPKKPTGGEVVTKVDPREQYVVYKKDENTGKWVPVAVRTGAQILDKMTYNPNRDGWINKTQGRKYIVRKKK